MKVAKKSILILKLRILNFSISENGIFLLTFFLFIVPTIIIYSIDIMAVIITLICHYLLFIFKLKKLCIDILPEKRKIEYVIDILKKRKY